METYQLKVTNNSNNDTTFALYLEQVETFPGVWTLVWMCGYCVAGASVSFTWKESFSGIWCQPGKKLDIGVICNVSDSVHEMSDVASSQLVPLDSDNNHISLSFLKSHGTYKFNEVGQSSPSSSYITSCDGSVPNGDQIPVSLAAGIGLGLSGQGGLLVNAQANMSFDWQDSVKYRLVFGNYNLGEIIDADSVSGQSLAIDYSPFSCSLAAQLSSANQLVLME
ncbi:hypothetical protein MIB92_05470 [Aestuariirhabdus sp. Z084]|uniref:hypothetical protein n=1 Tax=Aestuariirhabdus haliotis TaxID=2918751 RepID=UPI00201B3CBF|nr:hypothetical protein [Aestuariirhabdus haliotis]MCL6415091.1 hypothetical protein [Aestuariirhabdus haliotis]MCL6419023.1 hypothetical protein [Aestuariirhabdus haliotis]